MKVALDGGAPVQLCDAPDGRGGSWSATGVIVFGAHQIESGLMRISQAGGEVEPATLLDAQQGENSHRWPVFLPDGRHFLYFVRALSAERAEYIWAGSIVRRRHLVRSSSDRTPKQSMRRSTSGERRRSPHGVGRANPGAWFDARRRLLTGDPRTLDLPAAGKRRTTR